ncbi:MAG TPA: threonine/serine dehydratase [Blastocatellia bacterium]|nr:threonine/serine dehydratase [Blastocatellia bacterium]
MEAGSRIRPLVRETPVDYSLHLSRVGDANVYLKLEHLQHTGSFKLRGATNKILSLTEDQLRRGVVAASTGNHGMGVCYAARHLGTAATIFLPQNTSEQKLAKIKNLGGTLVISNEDCLDAENKARAVANESGQVFISPYNDLRVIAGQGTIGIELARQLDRIDVVFVTVGGGGLVAGLATFLKSVNPHTRIVGCWPENARALYECLRAGRIIEFPEEPTISESTTGGLEENSVTFPLCQQLIDDHALVSESEIREAMRLIFTKEHRIIEGSAAVAVAAYLKKREMFAGQNVVIILCGRNIASEKLIGIL